MGAESTERYRWYSDCLGKSKPKKEKVGENGCAWWEDVPKVDSLEVGPGYDLVAFRIRCVELNGNAQTVNPHRSLGAETLDGLQETPSGHGTQLDLVLIQHARSTDDAPPIIETLHDRQSLSQRNDGFIREDRVEDLPDLSSAGLRGRGDRGGDGEPVAGTHTQE